MAAVWQVRGTCRLNAHMSCMNAFPHPTGTAAVTYGWAGLLLTGYAVVAMVAGTTLFARRDVAT
jgi:hypothetical protein